jgi:hypothetical protein
MNWKSRRLALASIAVVVVLCLVGVAVAATAAGGSALAYQVNGHRVSQRDFDDLLDQIGNAKGVKNPSQPAGTVNSSLSASVMNLSILGDLLRGVAEQRGVELTDADRQAGKQAAESQVSSFSAAPKAYQDLLIDLFGYANALGLTDSTALNTELAKLIRQADVYVNPRYGRWTTSAGVCAPTGCASNQSGGG